MLTFDEPTHTYTFNGVLVKSVSQLIDEYGFKPYYHYKVAAYRGSLIHKAVEGELKKIPYESNEEIDEAVYKIKRRVLTNSELTEACVVDIKTGQPYKWHRLQTAFYMLLCQENAHPECWQSEVRMMSEIYNFAGTADLVRGKGMPQRWVYYVDLDELVRHTDYRDIDAVKAILKIHNLKIEGYYG